MRQKWTEARRREASAGRKGGNVSYWFVTGLCSTNTCEPSNEFASANLLCRRQHHPQKRHINLVCPIS